MTPWIIVKTDLARELAVASAFNRAGIETFLPLDVKSRPVSQRGPRTTRRRIVSETPLIPCTVFVHSSAESLPAVKYVRRVACDVYGSPYIIPGWQIVRFMATHSEWLDSQRKAHASGKPGRVKPKFKAMDADTLKDVYKQLFGLEIDGETGEIAA